METNLTKLSNWANCCGAEFDKTVKYHFLYGNKNSMKYFYLRNRKYLLNRFEVNASKFKIVCYSNNWCVTADA
jgi:hypothetical protein